MTVVEVIQKSTEFLAQRGVESPRLQVELLLAHVLQMPRMKLYLNFDQQLNETELARLREMIQRRGKREPLQHIIGSTSFCGLEIEVSPVVLIPRPETEILAEHAWLFLQSITSPAPFALDLATGSGCIGIALATLCPAARVFAVDVSVPALALAKRNAERLGVAERITFLESDAFSRLPKECRFNLIVSNPPYIPSAEIETLEREVRDFDPRLALDGGPDGLNFYRLFAKEAGSFLAADGKVMLEFGDGQAAALKEIFERAQWQVEKVVRDYTGRERFLIASRAPDRQP
ncbi:MAG: peptide chain release factor N(5)-glutamine methyltransferase [Verrucomicrobia bacterium]|nr:peptide chain release factor N(5)-glutamine methyltransferase [Verrucomicrobiota bacterium]